ncbi:Pkinase-domain-containing protein [Hesseltinella vesiculosa]|uniref:non-specific serine/threonine protein kinase n=1 Tax=Hesseltinella vesiculosa TaxID=101127 RepID=A0A1X2G3S9_9FUNG|nr:Pkinase-domain-containing protein [Hesseltinella vesiculosa]
MTTVPYTAIPSSSHDKPAQETVGNYVILEKIGQGSFATVYTARHKDTGHRVAIKSVLRTKLTKKLLENLESEIAILKAIRHDHIVGLSECQETETHIHLVMDYCSLGDLSQYIKRIRHSKSARGPLGGLPEATVRHFLKHLVSALRFLRSQNLVHRDIKPQNLLLVSPEEVGLDKNDLPQLQVADFGFARFLPSSTMADTLCGSPLYMGPEILSYKKYDAKADLWSVGAVLYEMITGRPPFRAQNHIELLKKIQDNQDRIRFPDEKSPDATPLVTDDLKDLIRKLLKQDPVERISFEELFAHPVIHQPITPDLPPARPLSSPSHHHHHHHHHHHPPSRPAHAQQHPPMRSDRPGSPSPSDRPTGSPTTRPPPSNPPPRINTHVPNRSSHAPVSHQDPTEDDALPFAQPTTPGRRPATMPHRPLSGQHGSPTTNDTRPRPHTDERRRDDEEDVLQEYVVLDRRTIETNQFADEIMSPHHPNNTPTIHHDATEGKQVAVAIPRRKSSTSSSSDQTGYLPSSASPSTPPFMISRERRMSAGTAGTALAKALSMASVRLFGTGHSPPNPSATSPPSQQQRRLSHGRAGSPRAFMLTAAEEGELEEEDEKTFALIERAAYMGHAVGKFADSKFDLLMQNTRQPHPYDGHAGSPLGLVHESILAAEALVLHVKALALLEEGLRLAKKYWQQCHLDTRTPPTVSLRLNEDVQWMRNRFNECLDRASMEKSRCDQEELDTLPYHNACVEKLLYDRALELCRAAAVHELVGENVVECEQDYRTAIWMLEAILEVGDDKDVSIEDDDQRIINKFIDSIQQRISVLRRK